MILVDLQQTAVAQFSIYNMPLPARTPSIFVTEDRYEGKTEIEKMRLTVLRALKNYKQKFGEQYGQLVLCCDSRSSWRKEIFPYYKIRRKRSRDDSPMDWTTFHETFRTLKEEFRENLPYKVVEAEGAEGDDIISVLCEWNANKPSPEPVLIYSSDGDFLQLQKYSQVSQYDKMRDRFLKCENPVYEVREMIIRGDPDDDVPNILSADDCFAAKVRQRPMMTAKVDVWKTMDPETITDWDADTKLRYKRNQLLVDLSCIPTEVKARIAQAYLSHQPQSRQHMYKYLLNTKTTELMSSLGDF
jgi:hypothetical protein